LRIPSGSVTDSDALPSDVLYPIPGNDAAFGSIYFLNQLVAKTVLISKINLLLNFGKKYNFRRHKSRRFAA
jgi:ribosomal protein S2